MARINNGIKVLNPSDTVPTDEEGGYAGGDSTAAAVGLAGSQSSEALRMAQAAQQAVTGEFFGPLVTQLTLVEKGAITNPSTPRPSWPGVVDWWVTVGSEVPVHAIPGDLVTEVAPEPLPWRPTDLALVLGWYDAASLNLGGGGNVNSWPDRSGRGNHLSTKTGQPTYSTAGLNGAAAVEFDGVSGLSGVMSESSGNGPIYVGWTGSLDATGAPPRMFWGGLLPGNGALTYGGSSGTTWTVRRNGAATPASTAAIDTAPHVFLVQSGPSTAIKLWIDGTLAYDGASGTSGFTDLTVGYATNGSTTPTAYWLDGKVGQLVYGKGELTTEERDAMHGFLTATAGL